MAKNLPAERSYEVALYGERVGLLRARSSYSWFSFCTGYFDSSSRAVLGLRFEDMRSAGLAANVRLPPWFSNLLPEGRLRTLIASQNSVPESREMDLLEEVGHDLPGAVTVKRLDEVDGTQDDIRIREDNGRSDETKWRFSLAGIQFKFSMMGTGDRFSAPASGESGNWILKLPDHNFSNVPLNEFAMMTLAKKAGIEVPEIRMVHRENISSVPNSLWPASEPYAYAIRRFDRQNDGSRVHMEDLSQVRGIYSDQKYQGNFETVASLFYRRQDQDSLLEFVRRLAFNTLIRNGDAHLKNWSLLYVDHRRPQISPAYDLVSTGVYPDVDSEMALKLNGTRRFDAITLKSFAQLQQRILPSGPSFEEQAEHVVKAALDGLAEVGEILSDTTLQKPLDGLIRLSAKNILRRI